MNLRTQLDDDVEKETGGVKKNGKKGPVNR